MVAPPGHWIEAVQATAGQKDVPLPQLTEFEVELHVAEVFELLQERVVPVGHETLAEHAA